MPLKNNVKKKTKQTNTDFKRGRTSLWRTLEKVVEGRINIRLRGGEKRESERVIRGSKESTGWSWRSFLDCGRTSMSALTTILWVLRKLYQTDCFMAQPSALSLSGNSSRSLVLCACCSSASPNPTCPELCKLQRSMCSFYLLTGLLWGSTLGFVLGEWSQIGYPLTLESRWWQSYFPAFSCPPIKEF